MRKFFIVVWRLLFTGLARMILTDTKIIFSHHCHSRPRQARWTFQPAFPARQRDRVTGDFPMKPMPASLPRKGCSGRYNRSIKEPTCNLQASRLFKIYMSDYIRKFAWMNALTATAAKSTQTSVETITPITLTLLNQVLPSQPTVWNILQNPWLRWNHIARNQMR